MANSEKHKHNLVEEYLVGEEETAPAQSRGARVTGGPAVKPARRRFRAPVIPLPAPEPALVREPAPPPRLEEKHSQASSPNHLRKQQRLPKLRAPRFSQGGR